jgi:hypothetical protein
MRRFQANRNGQPGAQLIHITNVQRDRRLYTDDGCLAYFVPRVSGAKCARFPAIALPSDGCYSEQLSVSDCEATLPLAQAGR